MSLHFSVRNWVNVATFETPSPKVGGGVKYDVL